MVINIGDLIVFKVEDKDFLGQYNEYEGLVVRIFKDINSEEDDFLFEVKNPYFEYIVENMYVKQTDVLGKKRIIVQNKDFVCFKNKDGLILEGKIVNTIKSYDNNDNIVEFKCNILDENNNSYIIDESDIIREDIESLEII